MRYQPSNRRPGLPPPRGGQVAYVPNMPPRSGPRVARPGLGLFAGSDPVAENGPTKLPGGGTQVYVPGAAGGARLALDANDPRVRDMRFADRAKALGYQEWIPQSGIEDNQGDPYELLPSMSEAARTPMDPGIDTPGYTNPYRTVQYSITGLSTTLPTRVLTGNLKRTYLLIQNLGPGNMYLGIGTDPNTGGVNVLNLVSTQVYEQIGGGFFLPPNPWYPDGLAIASSFVSPEYISLMVDTAGTNAMILEGTWSPPRPGSH